MKSSTRDMLEAVLCNRPQYAPRHPPKQALRVDAFSRVGNACEDGREGRGWGVLSPHRSTSPIFVTFRKLLRSDPELLLHKIPYPYKIQISDQFSANVAQS